MFGGEEYFHLAEGVLFTALVSYGSSVKVPCKVKTLSSAASAILFGESDGPNRMRGASESNQHEIGSGISVGAVIAAGYPL